MSSHVHDRISLKNFFEVSIKRGEAMVRRPALCHQQPHWIIFKSKRRLQPDKDIPECNSLN